MDIRQLALDAFPNTRKHEFKLYHLASVVWKPHVADKLRNIGEWQQLLDMPVDKIGPTGIGALMNFMDADMLVAYLPAWLVIAYEHDWQYAGVLPAVTGCLSYEFRQKEKADRIKRGVCVESEEDEDDEDEEERKRFIGIKSFLSANQMELIGTIYNEMAGIHLTNDHQVKKDLIGISEYWINEAKAKNKCESQNML